MFITMACSRTVFFFGRSRLSVKYTFNLVSWRGYKSNKKVANQQGKFDKAHPKNNFVDKVKTVFNNKLSPFVDLRSSSGITVKHTKKETANSALLRHCLEESPDKEGFIKAVDHYIDKNKIRSGHVDFITTAMKFIEPYGLEKEIEVYEKLLDVFPRDRFENRTLFDAIMPKPHPQVFLALDILTKMEWQGIIPTVKMHDIIYEIFGRASLPLLKIYRMWFWFEELKDINPYSLPEKVYEDRIDIIKAAIDRIHGNNDGTKILELSAPMKEENMINYDHFIISSQTLLQNKYIEFCCTSKSLYVEGPSHIWINHKMEEYFIIKTGQEELISNEEISIDPDEQREGVIIGVCFVTRPYQETLQKWLRYLQEENETLRNFNIVFNVTDEQSNEKVDFIAAE